MGDWYVAPLLLVVAALFSSWQSCGSLRHLSELQ